MQSKRERFGNSDRPRDELVHVVFGAATEAAWFVGTCFVQVMEFSRQKWCCMHEEKRRTSYNKKICIACLSTEARPSHTRYIPGKQWGTGSIDIMERFERFVRVAPGQRRHFQTRRLPARTSSRGCALERGALIIATIRHWDHERMIRDVLAFAGTHRPRPRTRTCLQHAPAMLSLQYLVRVIRGCRARWKNGELR